MEAEVLPVEAQATQRKPSCRAKDAAVVMPVSLNEPVGFIPWCLPSRWSSPATRAHDGNSYNGVLPSRRVMGGMSFFSRGKSSRKRHTPLPSSGRKEDRRRSQVDLSSAGENPVLRDVSQSG